MASGGSSGRTSLGPRSFEFGSDDVLCSYDDFANQDASTARRPDPPAKDFQERRIRPLVNAYGQQDEYPKEEVISAVEKCMKKYADNLIRHLEGISGRLSQLEVYCYKLERSIGEFRADMIRDHSEADTKLQSLEKHLQEVHKSIQILKDKQELAETQKELSKLEFTSKQSASPPQPKKNEEVNAPSSVSEPKRNNDTPEIPNQHLALVLPQQVAPTALPPTSVPDQNRFSLQQEHHLLSRMPPYYPQQSQALQPELHYVQARPQIQDHSVQAPPAAPQQPQQPFPRYQQQWPQPSPQQTVAPIQPPTSHAQLVRPRTPPTYPYPSQQSANPETFAYTNIPESGGSRSEAVPFGYGNIQSQPQHQASSQTSFGPPPSKMPGGYLNAASHPPQPNVQGYTTVYGMEGSRIRNYQPGNYPGSNSVPSIQNQRPLPGNTSGFHPPGSQLLRSHPYADIIEEVVSMGYSRDQVASVISRMGESGQLVDFNALLDRLNSPQAPGGPPRAWSG